MSVVRGSRPEQCVLDGGRVVPRATRNGLDHGRGIGPGTKAEPGEDPLHLTVSIGLASFPDDRVQNADGFVALADQALYRAKNEGRNLVRQ